MKRIYWWLRAGLGLGLATTVGINAAEADVIVDFSNETWAGFSFTAIGGSTNQNSVFGALTGTLTGVSVNATLDASVDFTYADDLTVYVDPLPLDGGGLLQVGGFSNLGAAERRTWANGASDVPGTTVIDNIILNTPIAFTGTALDPVIWLGNGYGAAGTSGTFTGSITLLGVSVVPEPAAVALLAVGTLATTLVRRRRDQQSLV